jgi:NAD(P)-dependent dehydrogenase (short-subunit alcohol dehydrogenase family)
MTRCLAQKTMVVTGAARGIGRAIVKRLLAEGAAVHACDIDDIPDGIFGSAEEELELSRHQVDITDEASVAALFDKVAEAGQPLDGLVNNAGILDATSFDDLDAARFEAVLKVNLNGALTVTRHAVPLMAGAERPSIVNLASIMGFFGSPASIPYSTSKGAIVNLTRCLAVDLAPKGIAVNAIAPGFIETRMSKLADGSSEYATEDFQNVYCRHRRLPIGRVGQADEIAGPVCFLLSDDASYITGQILLVDGGVSAVF